MSALEVVGGAFWVVPNELAEAIHRRITEAVAALPESERAEAEKGRDDFYRECLAYFDKHGAIPSFSITRNAAAKGSAG